MTAHRTRKETKQYTAHLRKNPAAQDVCEFCQMQPGHPQFVVQTTNFKVVRNLYPYSLWDDHGVVDHLMIIPKEHIHNLSGLSPAVAHEYLQLVAAYEQQGYNIYARAPQSKVRSIAHQHTHLIKSAEQKRKIIFFIRRPYIRWVR
jgi:diadenosine tetraphosphate (Ap4A) HIT family hydrolase